MNVYHLNTCQVFKNPEFFASVTHIPVLSYQIQTVKNSYKQVYYIDCKTGYAFLIRFDIVTRHGKEWLAINNILLPGEKIVKKISCGLMIAIDSNKGPKQFKNFDLHNIILHTQEHLIGAALKTGIAFY